MSGDFKIGFIPLPLFALLTGLLVAFVELGAVPADIPTNVAILAVGGFACAEIGKRLPLIRHVGAAAIFATFIPSYLAYAGLIPALMAMSRFAFAGEKVPQYRSLGEIAVGGDTGWDYLSVDPDARRLYVAHGTHIVVIDLVISATSGETVATIALPGKPEFAATDPAAGRVYVNIEDKNAILAIDSAKHQVVATWPIAPGKSASGMAIDTAHRRLFVGCDNNLMLMIDSTTGKVVYSVPIGSDVDANAFDSELQLAFSSNGGEGSLTIAHEDSPQKLAVVQTVHTQKSARTMALDTRTHRVYIAAATLAPVSKPAPGASRHQVATVPGSFKILVYGPGN